MNWKKGLMLLVNLLGNQTMTFGPESERFMNNHDIKYVYRSITNDLELESSFVV